MLTFRRSVLVCTTMVTLAYISTGCTRVDVRKVQGDCTKGVRYYRPKPYLFISGDISAGESDEPAMSVFQSSPIKVQVAESAQSNSNVALAKATQPPEITDEPKPSGRGGDEGLEAKSIATSQNLSKISMKLEYLPDFSEEYAINFKPGFGSGSLNLNLENGWNLTSLNAETDQQTAEIIGSIGSLLPNLPLAGKQAKSGGPERTSSVPSTVYGSNVPFGFYEAVIACDPHGRKQLYGWRYVGFLPFQSCPVQPQGGQQVCCDTQDIYGLVFVNGVLQFQRIHEVPTSPIDPSTPWPADSQPPKVAVEEIQTPKVSHKFQVKR